MTRFLKKNSLDILYEDNHILVVNKRSGDLVQGDKTGDIPLSEQIKNYIKETYQKPGRVFLGVVHRLDRPTSGIVLFAKTSKALSRLNQMLKARTIEKTYWALVQKGVLKNKDTLVHWLIKNRKKNKSIAFEKENQKAKKAILHYKKIQTLDRYELIEITLETGRHHQIRVQLAKMGAPVKGDLKYGFDRSNPNGGISLHARAVSFVHPVKKTLVRITASPPPIEPWLFCVGEKVWVLEKIEQFA